MATVQLTAVRPGVAVIQKDAEPPVEMTWGLLHEAQQQQGGTGLVYRWLMAEFCRCEFDQRNGRPWSSPRRELNEIIADLCSQDTARAIRAEAATQRAIRADEAAAAAQERAAEVRRVEAERQATDKADPWWPIPRWEVAQGVRFDTPRQNQGQIVEVSYGTFGRSEAGSTDPFMCVEDHSTGSLKMYKRREASKNA